MDDAFPAIIIMVVVGVSSKRLNYANHPLTPRNHPPDHHHDCRRVQLMFLKGVLSFKVARIYLLGRKVINYPRIAY